MKKHLLRIANFTCLETIERSGPDGPHDEERHAAARGSLRRRQGAVLLARRRQVLGIAVLQIRREDFRIARELQLVWNSPSAGLCVKPTRRARFLANDQRIGEYIFAAWRLCVKFARDRLTRRASRALYRSAGPEPKIIPRKVAKIAKANFRCRATSRGSLCQPRQGAWVRSIRQSPSAGRPGAKSPRRGRVARACE